MNSEEIYGFLKFYIKEAKCELEYNKDYEFLLAVMMSAQTTDKRVNMVTDLMFSKYDSLESLNKLSLKEIEDFIKTIGIYKNKAKNFKEIVSKINEIGYVPNDRKYLETLPGVGRKTANVVLGELYKVPCIPVDTHVTRVSKRLGLAKINDDVETIEKKLMKFFKKEDWIKVGHSLVLFGRYFCTAKKPKCNDCKFLSICKEKNKNFEI